MQNKIYYDGRWQMCQAKESIEVLNPFNQESLGFVAKATPQDMNKLIDSACQSQKDWALRSAYERCGYLDELYKGLIDNRASFAEVISKENGKPYKEALGEVDYAASFLKWYSEEGKRVGGSMIDGTTQSRRIMVIKQAIGPVYAITPWNFPLAMITRKLAPALAAGCSFILKPSEETPLTALKLFELIDGIDLPPGVVNMVTGDPVVLTQCVMADARVKKITFTGSTPVGKTLMVQSAKHVKNISLELGGHAPLIVFDDADLDKAIAATMVSKFRNCGQACIATNRLYVHKDLGDKYVEALKLEMEGLIMGQGIGDDVDLGPIINKKSYDKINMHIEDALAKGATLVCGGHAYVTPQGGYFIEPTLLTHIRKDMLIYNEETFGPVVALMTFESEAQVIEAANDSPYGLAAYFFTESVSRGFRVAEALDYGIIGFNTGSPSTAQAPFGGFKESGLGREGGQEGLEAYLETKYIALDL